MNIKKKEKLEINADNDCNEKDSPKNNIINNNNLTPKRPKQKTKAEFFREFPEDLIEKITSEIIKELIHTEIKNTEKPLLPKKSFKFENYDLNISNN